MGRAARKRAIRCGKDHAESGSLQATQRIVAEDISGSEKMRRILSSHLPIHSLRVFLHLPDPPRGIPIDPPRLFERHG